MNENEVIRLGVSHTIKSLSCSMRYRIVKCTPDGALVRRVDKPGDHHPFTMSYKQINSGVQFGSLAICDHDFNPIKGASVVAR